MTQLSLVFETLRYYWRTNLAVWLGVVVGTAVLGGALLVGDSVRGSLRQMTLDRLGRIDFVLSGPRFFREDLAAELQKDPALADSFAGFAPAIVLQATAERRDENSPDVAARAGDVNVYAVDERFWTLIDAAGHAPPNDDEVLLSQRLADQLGVVEGSDLTLVVEMPAAVPRDSLLGQRDESAAQIPVKVKAVLPEASGLGRLGLRPDQQLPANAIVSLAAAQNALDLAAGQPAGDPPQPVPARCNALFVSAKNPADGATAAALQATDRLNAALKQAWQLADIDLRLTVHEEHAYFGLDSRRMILEPVMAEAAGKVAAAQKLQVSPVLVYLANELTSGKGKDAHTLYSVVAGVDPSLFEAGAQPPFGPFEFVGSRPGEPLAETDILLNEWAAADLQAEVGDSVRMTYHVVGSHGELPEEERTFTLRGILKLRGTPAADRGYTPEVHGITDVESFDDWNQPFPMKKVTRRDDEYWGTYRATPKAFVALSTAQSLWKSRYGELSRMRMAPPDGTPLAQAAERFDAAIRKSLSPAEAGLEFQPIKLHGLAAASGTTDFAGLFLGFSLFLIVAALALISLLFRLGVERRASQLGLLLATGFSPARLRGLLLLEALVVVATGGLAGLAAAVGYASLMIYGLKTWWFGAIGTKFLELHVTPTSLAIGLACSAGIALLAVWWRLRDLSQIPVRALLTGTVAAPSTSQARARRGWLTAMVALTTLVLAIALAGAVMAGVIPQGEAFEGISWPTLCFFLAGMLALTSGVSALAAWIDADRGTAVRGQGLVGTARLALRNAGRQKSRSVLTSGLIATATFLIVAIAAGQKNPTAEAPDRNSGNGGFTLVAESSVPVIYDLNSQKGRESLGLDDPESVLSLSLVRQTIAFRVNPGDNASCLNIYQTSQPTILGVPPAMIERGGFEFVNNRDENPWKRLESLGEDGAVPVFGDMNTLQYSLHKGVGSVLELRDEENRPFKARVAGMFDGSVFQGVLLMSERHFLERFPSRGYQYFLIDVAESVEAKLQGIAAEGMASRPETVSVALWEKLEAPQQGQRLPVAADAVFAERVLGRPVGAEFPASMPDGSRRWPLKLVETFESLEHRDRLFMSSLNFMGSVSRQSPDPISVRVPVTPLATRRLSELLESKVPGFDAEPVADRLANFLAVQNTYLSTFQTLGGLGLLLGTIGLGTVMMRNVLERRSELALLRAVGFTTGTIAALVLVENALLLTWGLFTGTAAALIAMAPHLASTGADFSWLGTLAMLLAVLVTGMLAAAFAVGEAVRTPVLQTLRAE